MGRHTAPEPEPEPEPSTPKPPDTERLRANAIQPKSRRWRRLLLIVAGALGLVIVAGLVFAWQIWSGIEQVEFDPEASQDLLSQTRPSVADDFFEDAAEPAYDDIDAEFLAGLATDVTTHTLISPSEVERTPGTTPGLPPPPPSPARGDLTAYLIAGSDGGPSVGNADVIYLAVTGRGTVLYTIPRSLYLNNPCDDQPVRAALLLRGCPGVASGPSLLALALADFTGIGVRGFAVVGYSGFPQIVDALGGIEICSDTPRGIGQQVIIPAGCNLVGGGPAAWWVTNRSQDELVDGEWRAVPGDNEMSRSSRQSAALQAVITRTLSFGSAGSLVGVAQQVPNTFALGGMSIGDAAGLAMSARSGYSISSIPTETRTTPDGVFVLFPTEPFSQTLARNGQ